MDSIISSYTLFVFMLKRLIYPPPPGERMGVGTIVAKSKLNNKWWIDIFNKKYIILVNYDHILMYNCVIYVSIEMRLSLFTCFMHVKNVYKYQSKRDSSLSFFFIFHWTVKHFIITITAHTKNFKYEISE